MVDVPDAVVAATEKRSVAPTSVAPDRVGRGRCAGDRNAVGSGRVALHPGAGETRRRVRPRAVCAGQDLTLRRSARHGRKRGVRRRQRRHDAAGDESLEPGDILDRDLPAWLAEHRHPREQPVLTRDADHEREPDHLQQRDREGLHERLVADAERPDLAVGHLRRSLALHVLVELGEDALRQLSPPARRAEGRLDRHVEPVRIRCVLEHVELVLERERTAVPDRGARLELAVVARDEICIAEVALVQDAATLHVGGGDRDQREVRRPRRHGRGRRGGAPRVAADSRQTDE